MKVQFKIRKGYGVMVTIIACASSIWMMVNNFGFPVEDVIRYGVITIGMVLLIMLITVPMALLLRWWTNRKERQE